MKARYKNVAGRIITMALESVDYSEEKACRILEIVMQDDKRIITSTTTKGEIHQQVKGDACVDNEAAAPSMAATNPATDLTQESPETASDAVDHEERYGYITNFGFQL